MSKYQIHPLRTLFGHHSGLAAVVSRSHRVSHPAALLALIYEHARRPGWRRPRRVGPEPELECGSVVLVHTHAAHGVTPMREGAAER